MELQIDKLEKHSGERGWVSEIYSGELGAELQNIHLGTIEPGAVRGNHRHDNSREWIVFLNGQIEITWKEKEQIKTTQINEPVEVKLTPGQPHAFKNIGEKTVCFAAYRDHLYTDEDPDTEPETVLT